MSSFAASLQKLGYANYTDYLTSQHWADVKKRYRASKMPQHCAVCDDPRVELHHRSYARLGSEQLRDLVPLCRHHHEAVHEVVRIWRQTSVPTPKGGHLYRAVKRLRGWHQHGETQSITELARDQGERITRRVERKRRPSSRAQ